MKQDSDSATTSCQGDLQNPIVTVVMPTFNDEGTIHEAIESIIAQTFKSWELRIIDDASSDSTVEIAKRYMAQDSRILLTILPRNGGSGAARNRAIAEARGAYVAIMDADDLAVPERLEEQLAAMRSDEDLAVVASQVSEFGTWGGPVPSRWPTADADVLARQKSHKMPVPHPSCMFRTSVLRDAGGYDEACRRAQDYALFLKLEGHRVRCLPSTHVLYRTSRPISLSYVRRNARYADLALQRHNMTEQGLPLELLPTEAKTNIRIEISAIKSWLIRSWRERARKL